MTRPNSCRLIDPANSLAWFAMDFLWLAQMTWLTYAAMALTLATGGMLLSLSRRRVDELSLNAWMWMNALWLVSDLGKYQPLRYAAMALGASAQCCSWPRSVRRKRGDRC